MNLRESYARKAKPDVLRGLVRRLGHVPFAAVDPGRVGAVVFDDPLGSKHPEAIMSLSGGFHAMQRIASDFAEYADRNAVIVIEDQFQPRAKPTRDEREANRVNGSIKSAMLLSRSAGILIGMMASELDRVGVGEVHVLWVHPQTWAGKTLDISGRPNRERRKAAALALADRDIGSDGRYARATDEQREGIADAWALSRWWALHAPGRSRR